VPGLGGESAASMDGHGHMRVSRADRERTVDVLKAAFVHERLTEDELDDRVGRALAARTYADLDALTADIPAGPDQAPSPGSVAAPVRRPGSPARNRPAVRAVKIGASGVAAVTVAVSVTVGVLANPAAAVFVAVFFVFLAAVAAGLVGTVIAAAVKLESRQRNHSRGNTLRRPRSGTSSQADRPPPTAALRRRCSDTALAAGQPG
jgi:hypothetical protein